MNKADLVAKMYNDGKNDGNFESKAHAERALTAVLEAIKDGLKKDSSVQIVGFGNFEVRKQKARPGRNPKTGEAIKIPASKRVLFRVGKKLKDHVNPTKK